MLNNIPTFQMPTSYSCNILFIMQQKTRIIVYSVGLIALVLLLLFSFLGKGLFSTKCADDETVFQDLESEHGDPNQAAFYITVPESTFNEFLEPITQSYIDQLQNDFGSLRIPGIPSRVGLNIDAELESFDLISIGDFPVIQTRLAMTMNMIVPLLFIGETSISIRATATYDLALDLRNSDETTDIWLSSENSRVYDINIDLPSSHFGINLGGIENIIERMLQHDLFQMLFEDPIIQIDPIEIGLDDLHVRPLSLEVQEDLLVIGAQFDPPIAVEPSTPSLSCRNNNLNVWLPSNNITPIGNAVLYTPQATNQRFGYQIASTNSMADQVVADVRVNTRNWPCVSADLRMTVQASIEESNVVVEVTEREVLESSSSMWLTRMFTPSSSSMSDIVHESFTTQPDITFPLSDGVQLQFSPSEITISTEGICLDVDLTIN